MKIPIVKTWYTETVAYWKRLTAEYVEKGEPVPLDLQATILEQIHTIVTENLDNKNKHLFEDEEAEEFLWSVGDVLADLDDAAILDSNVLSIKRKDAACYRWLYLILKYHDTNLQYDFLKHKAFPPEGGAVQTTFYFGYHGCKAGLLEDQAADIQYMEVNGSKLVIEGRLSPIVRMNDSEFGAQVGDAFYWPEYTERYAHTKTFGVTVFKRYAFKFEIPLTGQTERLRFFTCGAWGNSPISVQFDSHFSRLSNCFPHSYWHMTKHLTMYPEKTGLLIRRKHFPWLQEVKLWKDMLATKDKKVIKYIPVRMFLLSRKIWKHRPIWMFMDKIYKAGDSSEYLYRYAMQQKDGIRKYYLIDKNCPDCKRLQKDGFKPLIRWSLKHRLVFLSADVIVATNSTVYAFNDMSMAATGYIRDLMHFHTVCVQHGLSVQKIAVAQNRLRDNTRLYFCASPYEIENLSKPVYGYENTNALQLTGVPRYDGLENRDKKQIMISPTWRMQAAMQVTKNEGVARDYNPDFKETAYYKVFNSLINDPRLIAAAKEYGYRIAYVLHPIVSPQVKDFDQNDYVDIIPAIGDMSYETMFCESSLLVTDYSGIQFDFAYLRKPLVYLHHKDIPQHYEEGTFHYDTMAFGEICHDNDELIDLLCDYMKNGCQMKPEYRCRADDFFAFNDRNNCQRVYDVMLDYQKNVIDIKQKEKFVESKRVEKYQLKKEEELKEKLTNITAYQEQLFRLSRQLFKTLKKSAPLSEQRKVLQRAEKENNEIKIQENIAELCHDPWDELEEALNQFRISLIKLADEQKLLYLKKMMKEELFKIHSRKEIDICQKSLMVKNLDEIQEILNEVDADSWKGYKKILKSYYLKQIFVSSYKIFSVLPIEKKALFLQPRNGLNESCRYMYNTLKEEGEYSVALFELFRGKVGTSRYYENAEAFVRQMATASTVFEHESIDLLGHIDIRPETKVIQLWHGCGIFKKIGLSTAGMKSFKSAATYQEFPEYNKYSIVTIASPELMWVYEEFMGINRSEGIIQPIGVSRTDEFFSKAYIQNCYKKLYDAIPAARDKKVILYAPTYRGVDPNRVSPNKLDVKAFAEALSDEYILIFKHHQTATLIPEIPDPYREKFAFDMTRGRGMSINELMTVADICISDYSSLIFEYSLFERPLIFFAYDLDEYIDNRGLYYDYGEITPGPVCKTNQEMIDYILHIDERFDKQVVTDFKNKFMCSCDGHSTQRIIQFMKS